MARAEYRSIRREMTTQRNGTASALGFRFPLGNLHVSARTVAALAAANTSFMHLLVHHARGNWGLADWQTNENNLRYGGPLTSLYALQSGGVVRIVTEGDRSMTVIQMEDESDDD